MLIARRGIEGIGLGTAQFAFRDGTLADSVATVHAALDAGVMLIDTALAYTRAGVESYAEQVVARALRGLTTGRPLIATKGGHWRRCDSFPVDGRPDTLRIHCEISLRTLETDQIDLYQLHHVDLQGRFPTASAPSGSCGVSQADTDGVHVERSAGAPLPPRGMGRRPRPPVVGAATPGGAGLVAAVTLSGHAQLSQPFGSPPADAHGLRLLAGFRHAG